MTAKHLKLVGGRSPSLNYAPPQRVNHAVPGAEWPFQATVKGHGKDGTPDVVITAIGHSRPAPIKRKKWWLR